MLPKVGETAGCVYLKGGNGDVIVQAKNRLCERPKLASIATKE